MSVTSADEPLNGRVSSGIVKVYARSTGLLLARREEVQKYVAARAEVETSLNAAYRITYGLPDPDKFLELAQESIRTLTDAALLGDALTHVSPDQIAVECTKIAARLGDMLCMVTACYVRYGLDRMWLDCSGARTWTGKPVQCLLADGHDHVRCVLFVYIDFCRRQA